MYYKSKICTNMMLPRDFPENYGLNFFEIVTGDKIDVIQGS
jgi:hypothetical protein